MNDHILTLHAEGLSTLSFDRDPASFVAAGRDEAAPQIAEIIASIRTGGHQRRSDPLFAAADVLPVDTDVEPEDGDKMAIWWTWFGAIGLTALFSFNVTSPISWFWTVVTAIGTAALWVLVFHWGNRAARRRAFGRTVQTVDDRTALAALGVCAIAAGGLFTWGALEARDRSDANRGLTATVTVIEARMTAQGETRYRFEGTRDDGGAPVTGGFEDGADLTVDEQIVSRSSRSSRVSGSPMNDPRNDHLAPTLKMIGGIAFGGVILKVGSDVRWMTKMRKLINA